MKQGWEIKKLGDIAYIGLGFTHTPEYVEKGVAFLSVKDISSGKICWDNIKYVSQQEYDSAPRGAKPSKGDIMFCRVGTMGKPVIIDTDLPFCTFVSLGYLHLLETDIINTYVKYWMQSNSFEIQVEANVKGIAIKNLNTGWLKTFDIPVPPREEQERIVEELDCLSGVIEKKREQLKQLDALAQSIFYQMFGDPITNEKGWEVKKLGEEFEVSSGGTPDTKNPSYWDNGDISWIGSNMCQNEIIYQNDGKHITADGLSHSSAKEYHNGYVLVALVGATIGKVALLKFMTTTNQNIAGINVPANKEYTSEYVFYIMQNLYNLFREVGGDKFKMANLSFVRSLPIPKPSYTLQQQFADKIEAIEKQKELIKQSITETEELFNSRMSYYFN